METYPDSALSILESITYPQKMPRADRALYALLLTQARHKNYIALEDDSLSLSEISDNKIYPNPSIILKI